MYLLSHVTESLEQLDAWFPTGLFVSGKLKRQQENKQEEEEDKIYSRQKFRPRGQKLDRDGAQKNFSLCQFHWYGFYSKLEKVSYILLSQKSLETRQLHLKPAPQRESSLKRSITMCPEKKVWFDEESIKRYLRIMVIASFQKFVRIFGLEDFSQSWLQHNESF